MYIFVFFWTPVLEIAKQGIISHGLIFTIEMMSLMIGSLLHDFIFPNNLISSRFPFIFVISLLSMFFSYFITSYIGKLLCYSIYELTVGLYYPAIGTLRTRLISDNLRTTIMNIFRIGVNFIVIIILLNTDYISTIDLPLITTILLIFCTSFALLLRYEILMTRDNLESFDD